MQFCSQNAYVVYRGVVFISYKWLIHNQTVWKKFKIIAKCYRYFKLIL